MSQEHNRVPEHDDDGVIIETAPSEGDAATLADLRDTMITLIEMVGTLSTQEHDRAAHKKLIDGMTAVRSELKDDIAKPAFATNLANALQMLRKEVIDAQSDGQGDEAIDTLLSEVRGLRSDVQRMKGAGGNKSYPGRRWGWVKSSLLLVTVLALLGGGVYGAISTGTIAVLHGDNADRFSDCRDTAARYSKAVGCQIAVRP